jgi:hypothetical protein
MAAIVASRIAYWIESQINCHFVHIGHKVLDDSKGTHQKAPYAAVRSMAYFFVAPGVTPDFGVGPPLPPALGVGPPWTWASSSASTSIGGGRK